MRRTFSNFLQLIFQPPLEISGNGLKLECLLSPEFLIFIGGTLFLCGKFIFKKKSKISQKKIKFTLSQLQFCGGHFSKKTGF